MADTTKKHRIIIESQKNLPTRGVLASEGASLLENLLEAGIEINHSCGGNGTCGTCCVQVMQGLQNFSDIGEIEMEMKLDRGLSEDERLCCQSYIRGPIKIKIPL